MISHSEGQEMVFKLQRGEGEIEVKGKPEQNKNGEYKWGSGSGITPREWEP